MQSDFKEIWSSLSGTERDLAMVWSMVYESLTVLEFSRLLNKIGMVPPAGEVRYTHAFTQEVTEKLHAKGLVLDNGKQGWSIAPTHSEALMRMATLKPNFTVQLNEVRRELPYKTYWQPRGPEALMREIRIAFYLQNEATFERLQRESEMFFPGKAHEGYFRDPLFREFDPRWVETLLPAWQLITVRSAFQRALGEWNELDDIINFLESHPQIRDTNNGPLRELLIESFVLRGDWSRLLLWADLEPMQWRKSAYQLIYRVLNDEDQAVGQLIEDVRKGYQRDFKSKYPANLAGYFHYITLLRSGGVKNADTIGQLLELSDPAERVHLSGLYFVLQALQAFLRNDLAFRQVAESGIASAPQNPFLAVFEAWYRLWTGQLKEDPDYLEQLDRWRDQAQVAGYRWVEMELTKILSLGHPHEKFKVTYAQRATDLEAAVQVASLVDAMPRIEDWERALEVLSSLGLGSRTRDKKAKKMSRFVWFINFTEQEIQAREQTLNKSGSWSKGRKVALKRVKEGDVANMTPQDVAVAKAIEEDITRYYPQGHFRIDYSEALLALVGHPHVYLMENSSVAVELIKRNPQLLVEENEKDLALRFAQTFEGPGVQLIKETPTRYQVIQVTEDHARIQQQIGPGLVIPKRARHRLLEVSRHLGHIVEVQSTLNGVIDDVDQIKADPKIYVHLLPIGESFKVEFFVCPIKGEDQYFKPGAGRKKVFTEVNGHQQIATRPLEEEKQNAEAVIAACPTLERIIYRDYEWQLDEVEDCLNILLELYPLRAADQIVLEHPRGEKVRLLGTVDFSDLNIGVSGNSGWFDVTGELVVDDRQVINFRELLEKVNETPNSQFVQLSEGQFVALTEQLRRKLREMEGLVNNNGDTLQLHPLAAGLLDDISDQLGEFESDVKWRESLMKIDAAQQTTARVPSTFKATLRPYQTDGFRWLSRLANWGVGACLADDMGLGKTIQGLALLLARAEQGPALIIAPASVTRNWIREANKFAPTINPVLLGPGDRAETIASVGPYDMLVVSYGLLPFEGEALCAKQFSTIILDEAQAIKNRGTKRSQIAMQLQGDFKVATTGTPIENHLGELWNLFNFLNPGLLGSYQRFTNKYTNPITKSNDNERRQQLRRLIQPFILRRRKEEVLEELPPKTEVTLTVELSAPERAFYEALRQSALEQIEESDGPNRRFQILAQLMKLRQAACHPKMVDPSLDISSSKLELVAETVSELRQNGHKVLIFSQFVRHLSLVRQWVDGAEIPYQYLDGSTPGKKRDEAVQAFQRGEGDVFLISLKAGGTGLTLTAADYVLHLDPWWNPAVEDQASDRAHRIGQQRPVTVYRFVAENTIEEKIVQLHNEKRDLADSLLAGTEQSGKLSAEDLLNLIRLA
ncbi:MAG: DEAD/DEAH box helicase [Bacteroidota bacterium]